MRTFLIVILAFMLHITTAAAAANNTNEEMDKSILYLIQQKDIDKLEQTFNKILKNYEEDYRQERLVDLAFDSFFRVRDDLGPLLNNWIEDKPNSYAAYMARGVYYTQNGWVKRGARYFDETSKQQLNGMVYFFQKAMMDFEKARSINKKMVHPLCYEIEILMNFSQKDNIRYLYDEALKINPMSLTARWYYISTLLPRWGGSIEQIEQEVESARPYYTKNPALKILDGRVYAERGDQAFFNQDYVTAERLYTTALKSGDHWFYNKQRGEIFSYSKQLDRSNMDIKIALALRPNYNRALYIQGMNLYQSQQYSDAIIVLSKVIENNSNDHKTLDIRGDCYRRLGKLTLALSDFEKAIKLDPNNSEYLADLQYIRMMIKAN